MWHILGLNNKHMSYLVLFNNVKIYLQDFKVTWNQATKEFLDKKFFEAQFRLGYVKIRLEDTCILVPRRNRPYHKG